VSLTSDGGLAVDSIIKGDTVSEVLEYVQFNDAKVLERIQSAVEAAVRQERIDHHEAGEILKFYEGGLRGYTYLEEPVLP
jgi:arginine decarboxylase